MMLECKPIPITMDNIEKDDEEKGREQVAAYLKKLFNDRKDFTGMTQEKLAGRMKRSQGVVWQYLNGKIPINVTFLNHFLKALRLSVDDIDPAMLALMFNDDETAVLRKLTNGSVMMYGSTSKMDDLLQSQIREPILGTWLVPELDSNASLGPGTEFHNDDVVRKWEIEETLLLRDGIDPKNAVILPCAGQSMEPTLHDGDLVIVDTGPVKHLTGSLYAIDTMAGLKIKRINQRGDGTIVVSSDNPNKDAYPNEYYDQNVFDDLIQVRGRVVRTFWGAIR